MFLWHKCRGNLWLKRRLTETMRWVWTQLWGCCTALGDVSTCVAAEHIVYCKVWHISTDIDVDLLHTHSFSQFLAYNEDVYHCSRNFEEGWRQDPVQRLAPMQHDLWQYNLFHGSISSLVWWWFIRIMIFDLPKSTKVPFLHYAAFMHIYAS